MLLAGGRSINCVHVRAPVMYYGGGDGIIRAWDLELGCHTLLFEGHRGYISSIATDEACDYMFSASYDRSVRIWQLFPSRTQGQCREVLRDHHHCVAQVEVRCIRSQPFLFSGGMDRMVLGYALHQDNKLTRFFKGDEKVMAFAVHEGMLCVTAGPAAKRFVLFGGETEQDKTLATEYRGHTAEITCLKIEGEYLFTGSADHALKMWGLESGACVGTFEGHAAGVWTMLVTGGVVFSGGRDHAIVAWDYGTQERLKVFEGHTGSVFAMDCDGQCLFSGSGDSTLRVWELTPDFDPSGLRTAGGGRPESARAEKDVASEPLDAPEADGTPGNDQAPKEERDALDGRTSTEPRDHRNCPGDKLDLDTMSEEELPSARTSASQEHATPPGPASMNEGKATPKKKKPKKRISLPAPRHTQARRTGGGFGLTALPAPKASEAPPTSLQRIRSFPVRRANTNVPLPVSARATRTYSLHSPLGPQDKLPLFPPRSQRPSG